MRYGKIIVALSGSKSNLPNELPLGEVVHCYNIPGITIFGQPNPVGPIFVLTGLR